MVGVPDEYRGEVVKAFVSLKQGESASEEDLIAFWKERMAALALEGGDVDLAEALAVLKGPGEVVVGEKPAAGGEHRDQRWTPTARPVLLRDGGFGAVDRLLGRLEIDPRVMREAQLDVAATGQHA